MQGVSSEVDKLQMKFAKDLSIGISNNKMKKHQTLIVTSFAAKIVAVHRFICHKGYRSKGLGEQPSTNEQYLKMGVNLKML